MNDLCKSLYTARSSNKSIDDITKAKLSLLGIIFSYIILHSFSEHKEFRFILPILPLIIVIAGESITQSLSLKDATAEKKMKAYICITYVILNIPHLVYLGAIHQRGPIAVNRFLANAIRTTIHKKEHINVHFLMGCHSAPVYSHLHVPGFAISAWHLDCSPDCRSQQNSVCESDIFLLDPVAFVTSAYCDGNASHLNVCESNNNEQCLLNKNEHSDCKDTPTFVILMQKDAGKVANKLKQLNMRHVASIPHTVKSVEWKQENGKFDSTSMSNDSVSIVSLFYINFDHIEVYQHK